MQWKERGICVVYWDKRYFDSLVILRDTLKLDYGAKEYVQRFLNRKTEQFTNDIYSWNIPRLKDYYYFIYNLFHYLFLF